MMTILAWELNLCNRGILSLSLSWSKIPQCMLSNWLHKASGKNSIARGLGSKYTIPKFKSLPCWVLAARMSSTHTSYFCRFNKPQAKKVSLIWWPSGWVDQWTNKNFSTTPELSLQDMHPTDTYQKLLLTQPGNNFPMTSGILPPPDQCPRFWKNWPTESLNWDDHKGTFCLHPHALLRW